VRRVEKEVEGLLWGFSGTASTGSPQCCRESYSTGVPLNVKG
jgi:hypothetical protein